MILTKIDFRINSFTWGVFCEDGKGTTVSVSRYTIIFS